MQKQQLIGMWGRGGHKHLKSREGVPQTVWGIKEGFLKKVITKL